MSSGEEQGEGQGEEEEEEEEEDDEEEEDEAEDEPVDTGEVFYGAAAARQEVLPAAMGPVEALRSGGHNDLNLA